MFFFFYQEQDIEEFACLYPVQSEDRMTEGFCSVEKGLQNKESKLK